MITALGRYLSYGTQHVASSSVEASNNSHLHGETKLESTHQLTNITEFI